ncbi:oxidoreductase [Pseudomonas sp. MYb187]|uniref:2Fe-2S iron-sulfur cluster-binding protein n=1 Tax=Pseudomonas TaxID=286 RepID=UPI000CFB4A54|nr:MULTISPECIES: 2Fe-2S iron-sulfur cluster-binding protein [unclassified Pseudomonas]MCW2271559.1 CDP-4-dehydro-6-deoxyglucose reductase/ferredoxin-NAD(P)+ reductase (naphthalene dioxygenase ferredoxin-specific) [Pseudomonas sp. JUb96]PRA59481.1 oxidoreductase [Pseudomonas sp. MYb187]
MSKRIEIRQAGRTLTVSAGMTVLEAALADEIFFPHGCRSGRCGSCKSRLISGEVDLLDHSRFALSDEEKAQGLILACRAIPRTDAVIAWLGGDEWVPAHPHRQLSCRVETVEHVTHDIMQVRLVVADGADPMAFSAGQYARLTFPGAATRDYSMASRPGERALEFHIRRVPGGAASERIHTLLKVGDPVVVEGPFGASYLREQHSGPMLCIAGGSGLAPIKSIIETALAYGMKQPIHCYFGTRSERDLYLVEHFERLAQRYSNLVFMPVLSDATAATGWRTGLVTDAIAADLKDFDGWKVYVAGPPAMVDAAMQLTLLQAGRAEDVHADVFFTPVSPLGKT